MSVGKYQQTIEPNSGKGSTLIYAPFLYLDTCTARHICYGVRYVREEHSVTRTLSTESLQDG